MQDVLGLATSGPTTSLPPRPQAGFGIGPSGPPAKDSKPLNISGNGFAPDSSLGDDVFLQLHLNQSKIFLLAAYQSHQPLCQYLLGSSLQLAQDTGWWPASVGPVI
ncbi:actin cytoskeleton-regulatory complex protein PAN1-like [Pyrus ussuriensis x Pyrus communis]|uniref:Actin cytoskeleton-regulatory complex protein PAN1-like n=1 Tax=Pyrus ussuriensis x Pyrus communis TaxID=2448454 RepID=A0A5N5FHF3_9ROSA|nr:actin cytoskeleton-regulatory complex protein PAN1-like [Pyrus ussuriensis x Pyrus communis]